MKSAKLVLFVTLVVFCCAAFPAHAVEDISLADAINKGLENNFQIRIAKKTRDIASNNNSWGAAGRYPTLDIGLNSNNSFKNDPDSSDPDERTKYKMNILSPYVNLRWVLFSGFSIKITKAKLMHLNQISEGSAAIVVENTLQGIILAYYKALLEREKLDIVEEVRKLSKDRFDYITAKKDVGAAATYDVLQARIAWLNDTASALLQEMNVKNSKRNLNLILGEPAKKDYKLTDTLTVKMHQYNLDQLLDKLLKDNKTLRNQYINQQILKKDINLQRSGLFPVVSLNSGINRFGTRMKLQDLPASTSTSYDYYVNFSVGLNLINGGNTRRAIANARINEKIGQLQVEEMKFTLGNVLRTTYELYEVRKQLYKVAEERLKSAKLN
ncbi:MAG: TolC family protein, partial [bacterium]|nr:TolC family protein [bacterium]